MLKKEILETAAEKAGMIDLKYGRPSAQTLSKEERKDIAWWQELLDEYPNQLIIATKR